MATKKETGKALTTWRDAMAKSAAKAAEMEKGKGGKFISTRAGVMSYDGQELPGNQFPCIILEGMYENTFYQDKFDPDAKSSPTCFAFGYDKEDMKPHASLSEHPDHFEAQADSCAECPMNEWGSAEKGKGKACSNRRRLAVMAAGLNKSLGRNKGYELELFDEEEAFSKGEIAYMKLPVTSVKAYSKYVREVADQLGKPLWAVFTMISVEPDARSQFKITFELLEEIPDEMMDAVFKKHQLAEQEIDFPYTPHTDDEDDEGYDEPKKNSPAKKLGRKAPAAKAKPAAKRRR